MKNTGIVFNIQRFTVHDGPGIRTELFLKGCTLRCKWCSNPESFALHPQVGVYPTKCIGVDRCGACVKACPVNNGEPFLISDQKVIGIDREKCTDCMLCQKECPSDALKAWGEEMNVDQVMEIIRSDRAYYEKSGGGVTISGGEALFQWEFALEILKACKKENIHTCVESALGIKPDILEQVLLYCDMIITDIKLMDDADHATYTGMGNQQILENISTVVHSGVPVVLRLPIIPEVNDTQQHIEQVGDFIINELGNRLVQVQFLRFRRLGEEKYQSLGMTYPMEDFDPDRAAFEEQMKQLVAVLQARGIRAFAGTTNKIMA